MSMKWSFKNEIIQQLLFFVFPLGMIIVAISVTMIRQHPLRYLCLGVAILIGGGVYLWKRKR